MSVDVRLGDCLHVMRGMADNSVHAVVTDPPYGLGFMGKAWDDLPPGVEWAAECLRVLKPGGFLLAFGGTRTYHRLACAVEDAGFEIRDSIAWLYGSGFPKSLDVGKAIDKAAGAEREVIGADRGRLIGGRGGASTNHGRGGVAYGADVDTAPATPAAREWAGWGTALKPAFEPIVVARKPLTGTVAANVQTHGTGALNIAACRVGMTDADRTATERKNAHATFGSGPRDNRVYGADNRDRGASGDYDGSKGRWPANVVLDSTQADALDQQSGIMRDGVAVKRGGTESPDGWGTRGQYPPGTPDVTYGGGGGASRFFPTFRYQAKAPTAERPSYVTEDGRKISHPTVKPLGLMRWLVRLVTPPGGVVLDPFAGSGATLEACLIEGFDCIAIERDPESLPLIQIRIDRQADTLPFGEAAG